MKVDATSRQRGKFTLVTREKYQEKGVALGGSKLGSLSPRSEAADCTRNQNSLFRGSQERGKPHPVPVQHGQEKNGEGPSKRDDLVWDLSSVITSAGRYARWTKVLHGFSNRSATKHDNSTGKKIRTIYTEVRLPSRNIRTSSPRH